MSTKLAGVWMGMSLQAFLDRKVEVGSSGDKYHKKAELYFCIQVSSLYKGGAFVSDGSSAGDN